MAKQPRILAGETAAITGAARGIGRVTAEALLRQGMRVAIGDVDLDAARADRARARPEHGRAGTRRDRPRLVLRVPRRAPKSSSGRSTCSSTTPGSCRIGPFLEEDDATARRILDINVHGVILGMKVALPRMIARGCGPRRQHRLAGRQVRLPGRRHLLREQGRRDQPEPRRAQGTARLGGRDIGHQPRGGQHRTGPRPVRAAPAPVPQDRAPAGRRGDRRDAARAEVRRARAQAVGGSQSASRRCLPISVQDGLSRLSKADAVLSQVDAAARAGYELRASRSEPSLPAAPEQPQITATTGE